MAWNSNPTGDELSATGVPVARFFRRIWIQFFGERVWKAIAALLWPRVKRHQSCRLYKTETPGPWPWDAVYDDFKLCNGTICVHTDWDNIQYWTDIAEGRGYVADYVVWRYLAGGEKEYHNGALLGQRNTINGCKGCDLRFHSIREWKLRVIVRASVGFSSFSLLVQEDLTSIQPWSCWCSSRAILQPHCRWAFSRLQLRMQI